MTDLDEYAVPTHDFWYLVIREWRLILTVQEIDVLGYLVDHSLHRGRDAFEASFATMESGVREDTGPWPWKVVPVNLPRATFYKVLASLKAKGIVTTEAVEGRFTRYRVNTEWRPSPDMVSRGGAA